MTGDVLMPDGPEHFNFQAANEATLIWLAGAGYKGAVDELVRRDSVRSGKRALEPSLIERAVERSGTACPECQANTDPNNVPVHPGCHCSVKTLSVSKGISKADADELARRHDGDFLRTFGLDVEHELPEAFTFAEETAAVLEAEAFRFADLVEWVYSFTDKFNVYSEAYSIILVDPKEQRQQDAENPNAAPTPNESVLAAFSSFYVLVKVLPATIGEKNVVRYDTANRIKEKGVKAQEELQSQLFLLGPNPTPEEIAQAFAEVTQDAMPSPQADQAVEAAPDTEPSPTPGAAPEETATA